MKKLKIFLDASAISNLYQDNMPNEMADMKTLWNMIEQGEYEMVFSTLVEHELSRIADPQKNAIIKDYIDQIGCEPCELTTEMEDIANLIIKHGILKQKDYNDCMHIACAMVTGCDCLVSYNFDDINNVKTMKGVRTISLLQGYGDIDIVTAASLIKKGEKK